MAALRDRLEQYLTQRWYSTQSTFLLRPFSWCYGQLARRRRERTEARSIAVPVIVIGNLTVGGTGKSPLTQALARLLQMHDMRPAILSRGYGGHAASYPLPVMATTPVDEAGDEALMFAQTLDCPVLVDPDRVRGAHALVRAENPNLILCDDGLQHYALQRDLELVVIDGSRGLGNGQLLPAGPLREPPARLQDADLVLCNGSAAALSAELRAAIHYEFSLRPLGWRHLASGQRYALDARPFGNQVQALAGIGNPERFFTSLEQQGLQVERHPKPDHFHYDRQSVPDDGRPVIMTAKDGVKCQAFAAAHWWVLEVEAELPQAFQDEFVQICQALISRSAE